MLEVIAFKFFSYDEYMARLIGHGVSFFGGITAAVFTRSKKELPRAPYFACAVFIVLLVHAVGLFWFRMPSLSMNYLGVSLIISFVVTIAGGFFYGFIALARSRDAYGHGRMWFLAWIPIANLVLLLKPSNEPTSPNRMRTIRLMNGGLGVLTGTVLLAASLWLNLYVKTLQRDEIYLWEWAAHNRISPKHLDTFMTEEYVPIFELKARISLDKHWSYIATRWMRETRTVQSVYEFDLAASWMSEPGMEGTSPDEIRAFIEEAGAQLQAEWDQYFDERRDEIVKHYCEASAGPRGKLEYQLMKMHGLTLEHKYTEKNTFVTPRSVKVTAADIAHCYR